MNPNDPTQRWPSGGTGPWGEGSPSLPPPPQPPPPGTSFPGSGATGNPGWYGIAPPAPTNSKAVVSLVLGIASLAAGCMFFTGVPAIVVGHLARREIRGSGGRQQGDPMALAGIITGWIGTAIGVLGLALVIFVWMIAPEPARRFEPVDGPIGGINSDPADGRCNSDRFWQDPDC